MAKKRSQNDLKSASVHPYAILAGRAANPAVSAHCEGVVADTAKPNIATEPAVAQNEFVEVLFDEEDPDWVKVDERDVDEVWERLDKPKYLK